MLNKFVAAEITTTIRHIPIEVPLGKTEGMTKPCVVNCDNLRTISKIHLVEKIRAYRRAEFRKQSGQSVTPWRGRTGS